MHKYRLISKKGEGTFSEVLKAQSIKSGKYVAIKCMKNHFDSIDQVNNLREIQALRRLAGHPNIIKLHEVLYDEPTGRLALVFELMDMNLYEAIKGRRHYLPEDKVKQYVYEVLKALDHMHRNGIFHRDVKPENLLLLDDEIKLADLGSCRGIYSRQPYTEYISTRWYRAPECLLTDGYYNFKMDLFAAGCVWFEIVALFPLFPGQNEMDQIQKIHNVLGTPPPELLARKFKRNASHMDFNFPEKKGTGIERLVPHADPDVIELMKKLIRYDPDERVLARQALKDPYFRDLRDAEKERLSGSAPPLASTVERNARSSGARDKTVQMSASSSTASMNPSETPEAPTNAPSRSVSPSWEERTGGLPNISQPQQHQRKGGGAGGAAPAPPIAVPAASVPSVRDRKDRDRSDRDRNDRDMSPTAGGGGGGGGVAAAASSAAGGPIASDPEDTADDGTLLPPIGGIKGKRDSKSKTRTFKAAGAAALQKQTVSLHSGQSQAAHPLGVLGTSKGFSGSLGVTVGGASSGMSSTGAVSSHTHAQNWSTAKDQEHLRGVMGSSGSNTAAAEKMNSTWAPNQHNSRKYVSPFGHKLSRDPGPKKR